jgi:large subunit ribosomal protein L38e
VPRCSVYALCVSDVKIKRGASLTKFKLRLSRYLFTLKVSDAAKADKIAQSFPPGLKKEELK